MQIKEVKPASFLFFRTETTVSQLANYLSIGQSLYAEAVRQNLRISGAIHWHYHKFFGDINSPFTLEICLPVEQTPQEYDGTFHVKRTDSYRCVSEIHDGNWLDIPKSYEKMLAFASQSNLAPTGNNREIYVNVDFTLAEANVTEIQLGVS